MADNTVPLCKTTVNLKRFNGVKGIYIMHHMLTRMNKVGRTKLLDKRYGDISSMINPHLILAFFPTDDYDKVEILFHHQHRKHRHEYEYFDLNPNYIYDWMCSMGLENVFTVDIHEGLYQQIRANWIRARIDGSSVSFNTYFKNEVKHASRKTSNMG